MKGLFQLIIVLLIIGALLYLGLVGLEMLKIAATNRPLINLPSLPTALPPTPVEVVMAQATQMSEAGNPIPTPELVYIKNTDTQGLQDYLNKNAKNWQSISLNIHSLEVAGVSPATGPKSGIYGIPPEGGAVWDEIHSQACDWPLADKNPLCGWYKVGFMAIYKGILVGGVSDTFIFPSVNLKDDWGEIERSTEGNKTTVVEGATAVITYIGTVCLTAVEENSFTPVHQSEVPPTDKSYTVRVEEKHNWSDDGSLNEDYLRNQAEGRAKIKALTPEKVTALYELIQKDLGPTGDFRKQIEAFYTPELASMFGVKGFEIVFQVTPGDPGLRCDGSPIIK